MAKLSSTDLLAQFKEMTLVELSDFVKAFESDPVSFVYLSSNDGGYRM